MFYQLMQVKVQVQNQILIWILMSKDLMQTGMACHKMIYYPLIAYIFITNELIFKNFSLSDCRKAKFYSGMFVVVLQRFFHIEKKMDKPAPIKALDGMRRKRPIFPVNILDVIRQAELVCMSYREHKFFDRQDTSLLSTLQNVSYTWMPPCTSSCWFLFDISYSFLSHSI